MVLPLAWIAGAVVVLLLCGSATWWLLAGDVRVLARLQSPRYSLFEVVRSTLPAFRAGGHAAEDQQDAADDPTYVPLLSQVQKTFVLSDIELVRHVLNDAVTFDRARTLESFADAFRLESVFTTKDLRLRRELKSYFARHTNKLSAEQYDEMLATLRHHTDSMLSTFGDGAGVAFIPKVEGMVLAAYADAFFGMKVFPDAEECAVLIKEIWRIKSLRNNVPLRRWDPRLLLEMRSLQRRLFDIVDRAQALADGAGSPAAAMMAHVYAANGYSPGNLLNALIPLYEAIARGMVYVLVELADNPSIQEELRAEFALHGHDELEYCQSTETLLSRVWQEALRLHPPTPNQTRVTTADDERFPLGSKVVVVWNVFHRDPRVWGPDADEFDPDRWLDVTPEQEDHYNPFGMGAQRCVARGYASFGGHVMLKRIVESALIHGHAGASAREGFGADRGYSRGPDADSSTLRFTSLARDDAARCA